MSNPTDPQAVLDGVRNGVEYRGWFDGFSFETTLLGDVLPDAFEYECRPVEKKGNDWLSLIPDRWQDWANEHGMTIVCGDFRRNTYTLMIHTPYWNSSRMEYVGNGEYICHAKRS